MTSLQVREARMALGWSKEQLAAASGTARHVVCRFEQVGRVPAGYPLQTTAEPLAAIRRALEAAGVTFINDNDEVSA